MANNLPSEKVQRNLLTVFEHFDKEDRAVRERQIRKCRRLKLNWDYIFNVYYSEIAHDWRIWENSISGTDSDQDYYDKPINILRAYIETVIAALSISTPNAKCYPEDAENALDVQTARAGDKIGTLIARHNNDPLLWLKALYTFYTEGTVFCYGYPRYDEKYGTYETDEVKEEVEETEVLKCATCGQETEIDEVTDDFMPEEQSQFCPNCGQAGIESLLVPETKSVPVTKIVGKIKNPKARVCQEIYGGLYVKIANYAKTPEMTPYLIQSYETHYATAMEEFEHLQGNKDIVKNLSGGASGPDDPYAQWGRLNTLYRGEYPNYVVTRRNAWLRPCSFNVLGADVDGIKELKKLYPRGVKVCLVNDEFGSAEPQDLDDYWTISINPMEDYLNHDPAGVSLIPAQEVTNDLISLTTQTIEQGIGQTFADPGVLNFKAYRDSEVLAGGVYEATPKSGKSLQDAFYQVKTATLSAEVMPFFEMIQGMAQLASGAIPSLFGGQLEGSNTASEYSMSRAQALQRIQNIWKIFTSMWKELKGKVIPMYINNMKADEKDVTRLPDGSFINVFIRTSELEGKIGKIELEAAENLPLTWTQIKDTVMKAFETQNPLLMQLLSDPANIPILRDAIGLTNFIIPGEDDRNKQNQEIQELLASGPIDQMGGMNPEGTEQVDAEQAEPQMQFMPSIEIDPTYDNHQIHFQVVKQWVTSDAGRLAKVENEEGYQNVLLHGQLHFIEMNKQMMMQQATQSAEGGNPEKPKGSKEITGENDVSTSV